MDEADLQQRLFLIEHASVEQLRAFALELHDIMWPPGDTDRDWNADRWDEVNNLWGRFFNNTRNEITGLE